jgi:hypothetical protein
VVSAAEGNDDLERLGLGKCDADELAVMRAAERLIAPMLEHFMALDLSTVSIEGELPFSRAPLEP